MSPDERDPDEIDETRLHDDDFDDLELDDDTLKEVPAEAPQREATFENVSAEDTLVQPGSTPTGGTARTGPTRPKETPASPPTPARAEPNPSAQTEPGTGAGADPRSGSGTPIAMTKTKILGEAAEVFAGRFEVLRTIGQGGMGRVYAVRDRQIEGRKVALKILLPRFSKNPDFRRLFFDEIRANAKFVSEYVVQIRDTGQAEDGHLFLTMDLVDGVSLGHLIKREGALQPRHGLEIARQVLLGLQPGHEKGIIHRDIKPSNVMLVARTTKTEENPFGVAVRLLDFGIAAIASDLTPGQIIGTPQYMSPEQLEGERLDPRTDLFSVGVLLYEMISGKRPFGGTTLAEISRAVREAQIPELVRNLEGLPKPIQKVLHKALQKDRKKRFQSAAEFIAAIEGSKAFQVETRVPAWSSLLLFLVTATAAAEGYYIMKTDTRAISNEALREDLDTSQALVASLRTDTKNLNERLNDQIEANNGLRQANSDLQSQLDERQDIDRSAGDAETRIAALEGEIDSWKDQADQAREERDALKAANQELSEQLAEFKFLSGDRHKRAHAYERLLDNIKSGAGRVAVSVLDAQINEGVFSSGNDGEGYLRLLVKTAAEIEERRLEDARRDLTSLSEENRLQNFRLDSGAWMRSVPPDTAEDPEQRMQQRWTRLEETLALLDGVLTSLEEERRENFQASQAQRDQALAQIMNEPPQDVVEVALGLHRDFGSDVDIDGYLGRAASAIERQNVRSGRLDSDGLLGDPLMLRLEGYLSTDGSSLDGAGADRLRLLWAAGQWYANGTPVPTALLPRGGVTLSSSEVHRDWEALLVLQSQFMTQYTWPPTKDETFVYRIDRGRDQVWWRLDRSDGGGGIAQTTYQEATKAAEDRRQVTRTKSGFVIDQRSAIDLNDPDSEVAVWDPKFDPGPTERETWARAMDFPRFQAAAWKDPVPCIVVRSSSDEYWLSPRFGMVRKVASRSTLELVYNSAIR